MKRNEYGLTLFLLIASMGSTVMAQESANFSMKRISVAAVGNTASSVNLETTIVIGQDSPSGASSVCNTGFKGSFGFWSVLGDLPVPIRLSVAKRPGDPSIVDLSWSGADELFQVFRSVTPQHVLDPANLNVETADCAAPDSQAGAADLIYYKVVAQPEL